jgi:PKD repeat protein
MKTKLLILALFAFASVKMQAQCSAAFTTNVNPNGVVTCAGNAVANTMLHYWSFDGGVTFLCSQQNITYTYTTPGTYTICHKVTDSLTMIVCDSTCNSVTITSTLPCNANFYIYPDSLGAPSTYIGVNTSTGTGLTYAWDWGDGSTGTGANPSHTYAAPGVYVICLTVTGNGCTNTYCDSSTINKTANAMYSVTFGTPTSTSAIDKESIHIYPNPATDKLFIEGAINQTYQVQVYTTNGTKVLSTSVKNKQSINIEALSSNIYILKLTDASGKSTYSNFTK